MVILEIHFIQFWFVSINNLVMDLVPGATYWCVKTLNKYVSLCLQWKLYFQSTKKSFWKKKVLFMVF